MTSITEPSKFLTPFAESGLKNPIPATSDNTTGKAGFDKGFPERTMLSKAAGGIPPSGMDFNGVLYDVTLAIRYMQAGGRPTYDAAFASAIGGYPSGAVLIGDDGSSVFQNTVTGNETDPNSGGAGWTRPDLQMMELYRRSYAEAGYNLVDGSFEVGGTLVNANDVLLQERTGKAFSGPAGTVAAGTNPASGGFVDVSDKLLRPLSFFKRSGLSLATEKAITELMRGSAISLLEIGKDDGVFDNGPAILAAVTLGKSLYIPNPSVSWLISTPITLPPSFKVFGECMDRTLIEVGADITPFALASYSAISDLHIQMKSGVASTKSGIDCGNLTVSGARSSLQRILVNGMGLDGITVRDGNLGSMRDIISINNGRDGINFSKETPNNNAWKLEGFIDVRANGRDGLHIESGSSASDPYAPKTHSVNLLTAQQNGRHNLYIGTRNNHIVAYCESAGGTDIYLDTYARGNDIVVLEAATLTEVTQNTSKISWHNRLADYIRVERNQLQLTGKPNGGWNVNGDDNTPGSCQFSKLAPRQFGLTFAGTSSEQELVIQHATAGQAVATVFGGYIRPKAANVYTCGLSSFPWSGGFTQTAFTVTSDGTAKTRPNEIEDPILDAWSEVGFYSYQLIDRVLEKGDDAARWHFGAIAQRIEEAFSRHGIDPFKYAILCFDKWEETPEVWQDIPAVIDADGVEVEPAKRILVQQYIPAGQRYSLNYEEALILEAKLQRRNYTRLEARITALENK